MSESILSAFAELFKSFNNTVTASRELVEKGEHAKLSQDLIDSFYRLLHIIQSDGSEKGADKEGLGLVPVSRLKIYSGSILSIEGVDGAGKRVLALLLLRIFRNNGMQARLFTSSPLVKIASESMKRDTFMYKMLILQEKLRIHHEMLEYCATGGTAITDWSIIRSKMVISTQREQHTDAEMSVYNALASEYVPQPHELFLYINLEPEKAAEFARASTTSRELLQKQEIMYRNIFSAYGVSPRLVKCSAKDGHRIYDCFEAL